jgi:hypothetical protein
VQKHRLPGIKNLLKEIPAQLLFLIKDFFEGLAGVGFFDLRDLCGRTNRDHFSGEGQDLIAMAGYCRVAG